MTVNLEVVANQLSDIHPSTLEFIPCSSGAHIGTPNLSLTLFDLKQTKEHLSRLRYFFHEHKTKSIFLDRLMNQDYWNQLINSSPLSMIDLKSLESQIEPLKNMVKKSKNHTEHLTLKLNELCEGLVEDNENLIRDYNHSMAIMEDIQTAKEQINHQRESILSFISTFPNQYSNFTDAFNSSNSNLHSNTLSMEVEERIEDGRETRDKNSKLKNEIQKELENLELMIETNNQDHLYHELDEACINTERKRAAIEQLGIINRELEKLLDHHNLEMRKLNLKKNEQEEELRILTRQRRLSWTEERKRLEWLTEWYQSLKEWREEFSGIQVELDGDILTVILAINDQVDNFNAIKRDEKISNSSLVYTKNNNITIRFKICEKSGKITLVENDQEKKDKNQLEKEKKDKIIEDISAYLLLAASNKI